MATDEEIHEALTAIHSRLGVIDGKATLSVRANREPILAALQDLVAKHSPLGQIYLLLDGKRTQTQIAKELEKLGLPKSEPTVSRRIDIAVEHGIAELVHGGGAGNVYRKDNIMESVLSLSKNVRKWLQAEGKPFPAPPRRSARSGKAKGKAK
jgi:hypothetical protein